MHTKFSRIFLGVASLVALVLAFGVGTYVGYENRQDVERLMGGLNPLSTVAAASSSADFAPFWQTWNYINEKYVADPSATTTKQSITDQEKVFGAAVGLVDSLGDPYSVFMPPTEKTQFEEEISGNFGGIGMEIGTKDKTLTVISALPDTPAKRAGITAGDKVIKINDTQTAGLNTDEAISLIRGKAGTKVRLTIMRDSKTFEVELTRAIINIPTVDSKVVSTYTTASGSTQTIPRGAFVISLYNFSAPSPVLFREKLREFILSGSDKLIIDLRGNPGGYLEAAVDMASWFLPKGKVIVRENYGPNKPETLYRSRGYDIFNKNLKIVILVDKGSASASEIFAGALSEYDVATVVGETTFGKGSVQELIPIANNSALKITVARWMTPEGRSISHNGLTPEVIVPLTEEDRKAKRDPQLNKALEIVTTK